MASLTNGGLPTRLGFHVLNTEQRGREPTPERAGPVGMGRPARAFLGSVWSSLLHAPPLALWIIGPFNNGLWT
jgi:hypothetical protein